MHSDLNLFKMFPDGSRGIAATVDFQEGEPLMLIPMDACIHLSETPLGEALDDDDVRLRISSAVDPMYPLSHRTFLR